jgi:hypothetical protein
MQQIRFRDVTGLGEGIEASPKRKVRDESEAQDVYAKMKSGMSKEVFLATTTLTPELCEDMAGKYLKGSEFVYITRDGKLRFGPAAILALVTAAGPGCASLAYMESSFGLEKSTIETVTRKMMVKTSVVVSGFAIPVAITANWKSDSKGPATRPSVQGCVRLLGIATDLNAVRQGGEKLLGCVFHSDVYNTQMIKAVVLICRNGLIILLDVVPGQAANERAVRHAIRLGGAAAHRQLTRDGRGAVIGGRDVILPLLFSEECGDLSELPGFKDGFFGFEADVRDHREHAATRKALMTFDEPIRSLRGHVLSMKPGHRSRAGLRDLYDTVALGVAIANHETSMKGGFPSPIRIQPQKA